MRRPRGIREERERELAVVPVCSSDRSSRQGYGVPVNVVKIVSSGKQAPHAILLMWWIVYASDSPGVNHRLRARRATLLCSTAVIRLVLQHVCLRIFTATTTVLLLYRYASCFVYKSIQSTRFISISYAPLFGSMQANISAMLTETLTLPILCTTTPERLQFAVHQ